MIFIWQRERKIVNKSFEFLLRDRVHKTRSSHFNIKFDKTSIYFGTHLKKKERDAISPITIIVTVSYLFTLQFIIAVVID